MNLDEYAQVKRLPICFLTTIGVVSKNKLLICPYYDETGELFRIRYRKEEKRWWSKGEDLIPYGLWREEYKESGLYLFVCEGESDTQTLWYHGFRALGIPGASTFKQDWIKHISDYQTIYLVGDNDTGGECFNKDIDKKLRKAGYNGEIRILGLPDGVKDISELHCSDPESFKDTFNGLIKQTHLKLQGMFRPLYSGDLSKILGLTIKRDTNNKIITFLCQLSAYSEDSQMNICFNAPSSTGKTYIPGEIRKLFPEQDVITIGYCSPTAFFHDHGIYDKEKAGYFVDLSRKILIFLDQPHTLLLQHLRPLLSHDKKEIQLKITDKRQKMGLRTKNICLRGYPAVIFCTAGLKIDEQEATRFLLLSPEASQEKIREAVNLTVKKEADRQAYDDWLEDDPDRILLKERIQAIREEKICHIKIADPQDIKQKFFNKYKVLKPRHSRDIVRIFSLIKCFALLNLWNRERDGSTITANDRDIEEAFLIWDKISESQELNLPPYIFNFYQDIILKVWQSDKIGLTRGSIAKKHFEVYGRMLPDWQLRQEIIPMLEIAGLIRQEQDPSDRRRILVYPTTELTISSDSLSIINNSELGGGVEQMEGAIIPEYEDMFLKTSADIAEFWSTKEPIGLSKALTELINEYDERLNYAIRGALTIREMKELCDRYYLLKTKTICNT